MMIAAALVLCSLAQQTTGMTLEEETAAREKAQKFLNQVAAGWTGKLPQERLLGKYFGRQWVGTLRISIKASSAGGGAAYEASYREEGKVFGREFKSELRAVLDPKLQTLSGEYVSTSGSRAFKQKLSSVDGSWTVHDDPAPDGEPSERKGRLGSGITVEANLLPLFVRPEEDGQLLLCLIGNKGLNIFKWLPGTIEKTIDGKKHTCKVLQIHRTGEFDQWFFSEDGRPLEIHTEVTPGMPTFRLRPIPEAAIGKPLTDPLEVKPVERRVLDMFVAIKKNDAPTFKACFDFDRYAQESVPNYATMKPADRKKAATNLQDNLTKSMMTEQVRSALPEALLLEEVLAVNLKTTEQDGIVKVAVKGNGTWKVHQPKDGPRKGQWLIFGIEE